MTNTICLNENYSTTRLLTKKKTIIENRLEDKIKTVLFLPESEGTKAIGGLRTKGYFKKSYEDKSLISIITVVFNGEKYLEETIQSVINQTNDNVEYIIIDGGSNDGTLDIIKKYEGAIDYWISEKDSGIYDAMNKGISLCSGEIVGIVNADDIIYSDTLSKVSEAISMRDIDYVHGSVHFMNEKGVVLGEMFSLSSEDIENKKYIDIPFPHPSLFVKKNIYREIGLFNTTFKLSADYDFSLRLLGKNYKGFNLGMVTGKFRSGGNSGGISTFVDTKNVLLSHSAPKVLVYKNMFFSIVKVFLLKYFPNFSLKLREKFRQKSRHKLYERSSEIKNEEHRK